MLWIRITGRRWSKKIFGKTKITEWWRDLPYGGDIVAAYSLLCSGDHVTSQQTYFSAGCRRAL